MVISTALSALIRLQKLATLKRISEATTMKNLLDASFAKNASHQRIRAFVIFDVTMIASNWDALFVMRRSLKLQISYITQKACIMEWDTNAGNDLSKENANNSKLEFLTATEFYTDTLKPLCDWLSVLDSIFDWLRAPSSQHQFEWLLVLNTYALQCPRKGGR